MTTTRSEVVTYYMSRVLDLPPLVAQAAYDVHASNGDGTRWAVANGRPRLVVGGRMRTSSGYGYAAYRTQRGAVRTGMFRWPVELELMPWSDRRTELGLRPAGSNFFGPPPEPILAAGHQLLARLGSLLEDWASTPLRELAAQLPTVA